MNDDPARNLLNLRETIRKLEQKEAKVRWELEQLEKNAVALGLKSAAEASAAAEAEQRKADELEARLATLLSITRVNFASLIQLAEEDISNG